MNPHNIYFKEVPFQHWNNLRVANNAGFRSRQENYAYGLIVDPLEYRDFIDLFEDLSSKDQAIAEIGIQSKDKRRNYSGSYFYSLVDGKFPEIRKSLIAFLETADKVSIGLTPKFGQRTVDHIHFRKHGQGVYSGSIRVRPYQLENFQTWGFNDPGIGYVKSDYFPIQDARKPSLSEGRILCRR